MKDQILKIAKVKDEKSFYKKYPTEEAFMAKHGKALKKAAMGSKMVQTQLKQLTDFGNPPIAQDGGMFNIANAIGNAFTTPGKPATGTTGATPASGGLGDTLQGIFGGDSSAFGKANPAGVFGKGGVGKGAGNFSKGLGAGAGQAGLGILNAAPQILEGIGQMKEQKTAIKKANQMSQLSGVTAQAAESQDISMSNRKYVRPEDALTQPGQLGSPQGTGTNYLAQYGARIGGNPTEVQNTYNPGDLYSDLGYEPLNDSNVKQFAHGGNLPTAEFGDYFQNSGQASIGKGVGSAIGSAFFGPLGGKVGGFLGSVAGNVLGGADDANKLANFQTTTKENTDRSAMAAGARSIQSANASFMKDGGSVVDYLNKNMEDSSMTARKKYAKVYGIENYKGTAKQNKLLLENIRKEIEAPDRDIVEQPTAKVSSNSQTPTKKQTVKDSINAQNVTTPFTNPNYPTAPVQRGLESGVIVDKNTNEAYVIKGNKLVKKFPVLTGQSRDGQNKNDRGVTYLESNPEQRVTPTGTYQMQPKGDIYGEPGFNLNPIPAFGYPAAEAKSIAMHVTYPGDFAKRNPMYSLPGEQRTASYGCPNCRKQDINSLTNQYFPQGDTTMVIDSRNQMDKNIISNLKQYEDGGWMNPEYNPQMIAKFGDYSMNQLLQPPHDADMLRAGGHLKEYTPPSAAAMQTYEDGGYMAMGGDLQLARGKAEPMSYNPFLPDGGETVMFRGPSHADGGMDIQYGQNGVEVEGGEPAVKLQDGGSADDDSLVVFGNMKIDDYAAQEIGDENANGKKYKNYIADLSKIEAKQNKIVNKSTELIELADTNNPFDQLTMNSGRANLIGTDMKLKNLANNKQNAAVVQNAILDTAQERGIDSDALAKGKIKPMKQSDMAKFGTKMETAQKGVELPNGPLDGVIRKSYNANPPLFARMLGARAISEDPNNYNAQMLQQLLNQEMYKGPSKAAAVTPFTRENLLARGFKDGTNRAAAITASAPSTKTASASSAKGTNKGTAKGKSKSDDISQLRRLDVENMPNIIPASRNLTSSQLVNLPKGFAERAMASAEGLSPIGDSENSKGKFDWKGLAEGAISGLPDFFRPTNQEQLDPNQLMAEQYALGNNQLEPVQAQTYQPMLDQPYDISLQDQINAVDAQANAAIRASGQNPAAQAYIMAQAIEAKNKIKGEEFRANQSNEAQTYQANRAAVNDASLKNLGIYDQQYVRQSQAKSNTKAQTIEALKSISSKVAQNKLENRQLGIQENMYGFRFGPNGRAYNTNNLAQFNMSGNPFNRTGNQQGITTDSLGNKLYPIYNKDGSIKGYTAGEAKNGTKVKARNGSIVKALKSL